MKDFQVLIHWTCKHCELDNVSVADNTRTVGGCAGSHGPGEYCYCPAMEVRCLVSCKRCTQPRDLLLYD